MGWLFKNGITRKELIAERTTDWTREGAEGMTVTSTCLAHCYRGGAFSGVLWAVWERTFTRDGQSVQAGRTMDHVRPAAIPGPAAGATRISTKRCFRTTSPARSGTWTWCQSRPTAAMRSGGTGYKPTTLGNGRDGGVPGHRPPKA